MRQVTRHCDRCGQNILGGGAVLVIKAGIMAMPLAIASVVGVFVLQATKPLHCGVALLGGAHPRRRSRSGR